MAIKHVTMASWDDVPHLTKTQKDDLYSAIPPYQRDARSKGVPQLGSGAIYPIEESAFVVEPFQIPAFWPRSYGLDVGWNRTAAIYGAQDHETDTLYLYTEYYRGQAEPVVHAAGIRAPGAWMNGVIDPAARGRGQRDGQQLLQNYTDLGLKILPAMNAVEAGIFDVYQRLTTGRMKVFKTLGNWLSEYRLYRRDEKGQVVKSNDHLMDATRYLVVSGLNLASLDPQYLQKMGAPVHKVEYDPLSKSAAAPHQSNYQQDFRRG